MEEDKTRYILTIKPAIPPEKRHKIQDALRDLGYQVAGGGTMTDRSECDISFYKVIGAQGEEGLPAAEDTCG